VSSPVLLISDVDTIWVECSDDGEPAAEFESQQLVADVCGDGKPQVDGDATLTMKVQHGLRVVRPARIGPWRYGGHVQADEGGSADGSLTGMVTSTTNGA
jgi:hypothetical protein